jgi:hypothetical protein
VETRRILVTGGTGLVGGRLLPALLREGFAPRVASRRPREARLPAGVEAVGWDGVEVAPADLAGCEAVVHLAGEPVFGGLPTAARRARIRSSRIDSTRALARAMGRVAPAERPKAFLCASAVGYYGDRGEEVLEEGAAPGSGFLAEVCTAWEEEARAAAEHGVRVASLRIGIALAREGGALAPLVRLFRLGLGGRVGSGRQWLPWIHLDDLVAMLRAALSDARWSGPVNAVAPVPVRNAEFTRALAAAVRRPALLPAPAFAVRAALGATAIELLGSRRCAPRRALELGFRFAHEQLASALAAEVGAAGSP